MLNMSFDSTFKMLLTMVFFKTKGVMEPKGSRWVGGFKEWADGWAEGWMV